MHRCALELAPAMPNRVVTPLTVEQRLVRYYLHTDGPHGAGPLRFIDASLPSIRAALEIEGDEAEVFAALARACGGPEKIAQVLAQGWSGHWPDATCPGFFRYLVLACAVVASADRNDRTREFGRNMQRVLNTTRTFNQRAGLPTLWKSLEEWCRRAGRERPIRSLKLPPPFPNQPHLGLTNAVAFPNWRDIHDLRRVLEQRPALVSAIRSPRDAATRLCPIVLAKTDFASQLVDAAKEYKYLYEAHASLLGLHRFWLVVCQALNRTQARQPIRTNEVRVELLLGVVAEDCKFRAVCIDGDDRRTPRAFSELTIEGLTQCLARMESTSFTAAALSNRLRS